MVAHKDVLTGAYSITIQHSKAQTDMITEYSPPAKSGKHVALYKHVHARYMQHSMKIIIALCSHSIDELAQRH